MTIALVRANGIKPKGPPLFKAKIPGAICPNNKNRNFATADNTKPISGERPKGHLYSLLAQMITKERAGLPVGKAGKFFGIHTSKAQKIDERMQNQGKIGA